MKKYNIVYILAFITYIFVNLLSITTYPFVHSDETWLAGLSHTIYKAGTFKITEPFFDLYPRQPHAIKSLFHTVQGFWIELWGYSVDSVRLLSLLVGLATLILLFWYIKKKIQIDSSVGTSYQIGLAFVLTTLMAASIQFIYAAHFGRQEIFILFFLVLTYVLTDLFIVNLPDKHLIPATLMISFITGISIGFHPNSFLIACVLGTMLLYDGFINHRIQAILSYVISTGVIAALYIYVSVSWNNGFIQDYNTFGDSLGATSSIIEKLRTFPLFLYKLYHGISATYHTPNIRFEMILFLIVSILGLSVLLYRWTQHHKHTPEIALPLFGSLGLTVGIILIGRYNATSIVFYLPFIPLLFLGLIQNPINQHQTLKMSFGILIIAIILIGRGSLKTLSEPQIETYDNYLTEINASIPEESKVLCNLNAGFAFNPSQFVDYRNLAYLKSADLSLDAYLDKNNIEYVVLSEEMDYIYRNLDDWDILYGNMDYFTELQSIITTDFSLVHSFESPQYGMRIVRYNDGYPWQVHIYKRK